MTGSEVQSLLLGVLSKGGDCRLGRGHHFFAERAVQAAPTDDRPNTHQIMAAVWSLLGQGLAHIDYTQPSPENWALRLTEAGQAAAEDRHPNPDDPAGYLKRLRAISGISPIVEEYAAEALHAYNHRLYRASAVMLGVASEAAVVEASQAIMTILNEAERAEYLAKIQSSRLSTAAKFGLFQQKIRSHRDRLPNEIASGFELTVHSVTELLRISRNAAGHPTGTRIDREECFALLQMFIQYAKKLYALHG